MASARILITRIVDRLDDRHIASLLLGAAIAIYVAVVVLIGRDEGIFVDERSFFYVNNGLDPSALLTPLNGHLELFPRLVYAVNISLFGGDFTLPRLATAAGAAIAVWLFFEFAASRVGSAVALALAVLLLFLGTAWEVTFIESGITHTWALAAGLGGLLALERRQRRMDILACALLTLSLVTITFGVAFAVGAIALIASRSRGKRPWWVVIVPLATYAVWLLWLATYFDGDVGAGDINVWHNLLSAPSFIASEAASTLGALSGLNYDFDSTNAFAVFETHSEFGPVLAVIAAALLFLRLRRGGTTPMLRALLVALAVTWLALSIGQALGRTPATARYVYIGGALLLMVGVEAARGMRLSPLVKAAVIGACLIGLAGNLARLWDGADFYRAQSSDLRAQLTALELAPNSIHPSFRLTQGLGALDEIVAGTYLAAVDRNGETGFGADGIDSLSEVLRARVDATLIAGEGIASQPAQSTGDRCQRVRPVGGIAQAQVPGAVVKVTSDAAAQIGLRRFASTTIQPLGPIEANSTVAIGFAPDSSSQPWTAVVTGTTEPVTFCS